MIDWTPSTELVERIANEVFSVPMKEDWRCNVHHRHGPFTEEVLKTAVEFGELVPRDQLVDMQYMGTAIPEWRRRALEAEQRLYESTAIDIANVSGERSNESDGET